MNEKVNIIKTDKGVTIIEMGAGIKRRVSKQSVRISFFRNTRYVSIDTFKERLYLTQIENVTIQDGISGAPIQLTQDNFEELTDDLTDSKGGVGGGDADTLEGKTLDEIEELIALDAPFETMADLEAADLAGLLVVGKYYHVIQG